MTSDSQLAQQAGVSVPVLQAIRIVESGGAVDRVRFEPHVFNRLTDNRYASQIPFTRDPQRGVSLRHSETNRDAFERAAEFDFANAVRSSSWGRYQVLGSHLLRLHPQDPVRAFDRAPATVSDQMLVSWFRSHPLAQAAANSCNISEFGFWYNGSRTSPWTQRFTAAVEAQGGCVPTRKWWSLTLGLTFVGVSAYLGIRLAKR